MTNLSSKTGIRVLCAMLAALMAVTAPFSVPIGPVPVSLGLFMVFLAGAMLPPLYACACVGIYLSLGLVGLPVFAGHAGGAQVLVGPTGGFLVGYFFAAAAAALARRRTRRLWVQFLVCAAGLAMCYLCGTLWFMAALGADFITAVAACVAPFALIDTLKALGALALARLLGRRLRRGVSG